MRMMPAGFFVCRRGKESDAAELHRTQLPGYKGRKRENKGREDKEKERGRKKGGTGGILKKNRILQIFVGII